METRMKIGPLTVMRMMAHQALAHHNHQHHLHKAPSIAINAYKQLTHTLDYAPLILKHHPLITIPRKILGCCHIPGKPVAEMAFTN